MTYRINYGSGEVSGTYETYAEARRHLARCASPGCPLADEAPNYRIERYDAGSADSPGEWIGLGEAGRLAV